MKKTNLQLHLRALSFGSLMLGICLAQGIAQYTVSQVGTYSIDFPAGNENYVYPGGNGTVQVPIGFDFIFFGNTYTECYVAENGFITFDQFADGGCCEGQLIPNSFDPDNLIAAVWTDMDDQYYSIHYELFGDAPNRWLAITFDLTDYCGAYYYGQVKLFETTNIIEIHTQKWAQFFTPCANVTQGIEDEQGSVAFPVPDRNANTDWAVSEDTSDFVSFTPVNFLNSEEYVVDQNGVWDPEYSSPVQVTIPSNGYSDPISLPFDFIFYGNTYNTLWMAEDGFITFNSPAGDTWNQQLLPNPAEPNNVIAGLWTDHDGVDCEFGGCYSYEELGDAPNRRFLITYYVLNTCGNYVESQIKLFEEGSIIELHTYYENIIIGGLQALGGGGDFGCYYTTQGIENSDGTAANFIVGRNNSIEWTAVEDFVRFTPVAPNDAGILLNIDVYCEGTHDLQTIVTNFGGNNIDSVVIDWTWNGVLQTPVETHFTMEPQGNYVVTLGPQTLTFGDVDTIVAWTSEPNGENDPNNTNDTATAYLLPGLQGTFTIGGSSPDYVTFADAIADLNAIGVCDTVIFDVRPGTYTEQITIGHIKGAFGNKIIFRPENGDSSSVIINFTATNFANNYVLKLDNGHDIIWERMTMNALGTSFARVIELTTYSFSNVIRNCAINGRSVASTNTNYACISSNFNNGSNLFSQNTISDGSFSFYHATPFDQDHPNAMRIEENVFLDFYVVAISCSRTKGLRIHGNTIQSSSEYSGLSGISVSDDIDTLTISNNIIDLPLGYQGMSLVSITPAGNTQARIFNNIINLPYSFSALGIGMTASDRTNVFHNTVRITNGFLDRYAFKQSGGSQDSVYNNVFVNTGGGPVVNTQNASQSYWDHNDYYFTGNVLGHFQSASNVANDLTEWQNFTGYDVHSFTVDPMFVSSTDLHVSNTYLNAAGEPQFSSAFDIDMDPRSIDAPDIGADEFDPPAADAGVMDILSPLHECTSEQNVEIVMINLGLDTLTEVTIAWSVNGLLQTPVVLNPNLNPEGDTAHINLGDFVFTDEPDTLRIWTSLPNNAIDGQPENDTLQYVFRLPLNGTYTIGGSAPDFTTFETAVAALQEYTICGPVVFQFRDGTYTEQVVIDSIAGSSATNTVTFESESGDSSAVTIQYTAPSSALNYLVYINGADYLSLRNLGFKATTSSYSDIIDAKNGVTHLTIENCKLEGHTSSGALSELINALNFGLNEYFTIRNNYFLNGQQAINFYNGSFGNRSHEIVIEDNTFLNQRLKAVDASGIQGLSIKRNEISTNVVGFGYVGIDVDGVNMATDISNNTIVIANTGEGMYLNGMNFGLGILGTSNVYNNMVRTNAGTGIKVWNAFRSNFYFNNVQTVGTNASNHHAFELVGGDTIIVKNNVFVANAGIAFRNYFVSTPVTTSDYNDLLTAGTTLGLRYDITYADLPAWQTGTNLDSNSISIDPQFVSSTDLHVLADTLDGSGTPIAGINIDFDGDPRNAMTPDIGADEIGANDNDAGILALLPEMPFASGNQDIKVILRNFGGNTLDTVDIHWEVNGVAQTTSYIGDDLLSLSEDTVTLGVVDFDLSIAYDFKVWTANPNSTTDLYNSNDTLFVLDQYAAVSDTVTVGGTSPDVATIQSAINAMLLGGILDSVHFQLRNGTYTEVITIPNNTSLNCATPVIFESESGDPADVIWNNTGQSGHTLVLNGADGLTFRHLTITTTQSSYGHAVEVNNGSHCNTFDGCIFNGLSTTSTSTNQAVVYSGGNVDNTNVFFDNTFIGGSYGLCWVGGDETGTQVRNNIFHDQYYIGLYLSFQLAPIIDGNYHSVQGTSYTYHHGIYLYAVFQAPQITNNQLHLAGVRGVGIYLTSSGGSASVPAVLANNFVQMGSGTSTFGIQTIYTQYWRYYHNTVRIDGGNATSSAIYQYAFGGAHTHLKNNVLYNGAGGYAILSNDPNDLDISNYNALFTTGTNLVNNGGTLYADLEAWQATGRDTNSVEEDPMWADTSGYVVTSAALNAAATPLSQVLTDIEGQVRDTLTPDIGCDEFDLFSDDVGILAINYPVQPFPSGVNTVFIKFVNNGQDTLTTMQVDWEVDNISQPTYHWTGLLSSAGTYDSLDIGTFDFTPYQAHSIKVWVSNPNGMTDGLASNDTLESNNLYPGLLGEYTIGGSSPDFDSLAQAVTALILGGAAGPVTFNIRTGTYLEPLEITSFPGCGCVTPVIFQSESGDSTDVIITNLGFDNTTLTLDGADGVIFQNLTLTSVNPAFRRVIEYYNGAHCNQFLNNKIVGYEGTSGSTNHAVIWSDASLDTANVFRNNWIRYGAYGFYLAGNSSTNTNTIIENNFLDQNHGYAVYAYQESGIKVLSNTMTLSASNASARGIELESCHGAIQVMGNTVQIPSGEYGINLFSCQGTSTVHGLTANNFISIGGTGNAYGMWVNGIQYQDIIHNNLHLYSSTGSTTNTAGLYLTNNTSLTLMNNVIANSSPGWTIFGYNNPSFTSDFNDLYPTGTRICQWNSVDQIALSDWQMTTGQDANAISQNPQFVSDVDLHVTNILLDGVAASLSFITTDIDGDTREAMPDMGADEFIPAANDDAGVFMLNGPIVPFASGTQPVEIALKNFGANTLTSATVRWVVNGIEQTPYDWTGTLAPAQCAFITIDNYNFPDYTDHDMVFWSEMPNGVTDSININDTLYIEDFYPALNGTYTVGGVLPDFNLFAQLENALNIGGIIGNVTFNIRDGIYSTQLRIEDFPRISNAHEITFQSESGDSTTVTIVRDFTNAQNYTIALSDAHQVTFSRLTLKSTQGRIMDISNGSSRIEIDHCRFQGVQATYINGVLQIIYSTTTTEDSVHITNNRFELGSYGIYLAGSGGDREKDVVISGNDFYNCYYRSIDMIDHDGLAVNNNTVVNDNNTHEGIVLTSCINTKSISGNDIRLLQGGNWGLYLYYVSGTMGTPALIANNFILIDGGVSAVHGIYHSHGTFNNLYYNTVRIENTHSQSNAFTDDNSYYDVHMRNCIFSNYGGGKTISTSWYSIYFTNTMDYCDLFSTGPVLAYWGGNHADLTALQAFSNQNLNSTNAEPLFADDGYKVLQVALDGTALDLSSIITDIEGESRNMTTPDIGADEFTPVLNDIGAKLLVSPTTYCGLSDMEDVTIRIQNFGSDVKTGFDVAYSIDGSGWHIENVGALMVQPGQTLDFTFTPTEDLSATGTYTFALRTGLAGDTNLSNDTLWNVEVEHIPALMTPVSNMVPADDALDIEKPTSLSWNPAPNATLYDVYIWPESESQSGSPQIENLAVINTVYDNVMYGETYAWQVIAKNICGQTQASPIQQFTIRELPDLIVDSISAPSMAVSEQEIEIEWQIKNIGTGHTQSTLWTDAVYLSLDATLNTSFDTYLGGVQNLSALQQNESYLQTGTFTIPVGFTGNYYVFVYADGFSNLIESNNNNNRDRTTDQMQITLLPPPDLVIDQVVTPASAFSGTSIQVQYTGRNNGIGDISSGTWKDRVKISEDGSSSSGGTILQTLTITGPLEVDSTYNRSVTINIPNAIFGDYYIYVETDYLNQVYEQAAENNNYNRSDTMDIILTPPPNLIVTEVSVPDTMHSNALTNFTWTVENAGGSSPSETYWYDVLYLSPSPIYNTNFLTPITQAVKYSPLNPASTYSPVVQTRLPIVHDGEYYVYAYTDRYNYVFEYAYENDNIKGYGPFLVVNPDLEPILDTLATSAQSGDVIPVSWHLVNHGPGNLEDRNLKYRYFISSLPSFDQGMSQLIKTTYVLINLTAGDSLLIETTVTLPVGLNDQYYLYVLVESSAGVLYEQNDAYANNVDRSLNFIDIDPGPYPDLKTIQFTTPDTVTAGDFVSIQYTQMNQGGADALTRGTEAVYLSFDSVWHPEFATLLTEGLWVSPLEEDSTATINTSVFVPATTTSNVYYLYIVSDKNNVVFEYDGEDNNVYRSDPVFVHPYPPVDIAVDEVLVPEDTLYSGQTYSINYLLRSLEAEPLRMTWDDAVYFSVDSILDPELDFLASIHEVQTAPLASSDSLDVTVLVAVPNGIEGDYYIIVQADHEDVNLDAVVANNIDIMHIGGEAIRTHIVLSPYPDLVVSAINAPSTAVAGQQLSLNYTITNMGTGAAATWQNRIYLSTDAVIANGDLQLYTQRDTIPLPPGSDVGDSVVLDVAGYLNGNYFLIVRTDYLNDLYEHNGESNNTTTRVIQITEPPPSDLVVEVVSLPDSILAGDMATISWSTKNEGSNPAQGNVREVIYLSQDTIWNVEDQVFGIAQNQLYLPPQSTHMEEHTAPVIGVVNQDYYALVRTDAVNNVPEDDEDNNISSSLDPAYIDVKTLFLDSLHTDSLFAGTELYYKLVVDPILEGESILVTLTGDSMDAYNELFISFDDAPTRGDFDISNNKPLSGKQQAVIKNAQVGTYYILGYGATNSGADQAVTLHARVLSFEILAVTPNKGSNRGSVTVVIDGARLDSTYAVRLRDTSGFVLLADTFLIVSSEKIIAQFDLRGTPVGFYHVECQIEPYYIAGLENGFQVIDGMGPDLQVNWYLVPGSSSPRNKPIKIVIEMINNGDADVQDQYIRIYSPYGNVMAWTYDDLLNEITTDFIDVPAELQNGLQGVLPPGNSAMYEVFSWLHPFPFFITDIR